VDSVYNAMTFDEKVGQFMVAAYSNKDDAHYDAITHNRK
jgi:hypothetical protein